MKLENMSEFNFNSQVCTDKVQSERLLALGLKKETADFPVWGTEKLLYMGWSLHRLLCLIPKEIELSFGKWVCININYNYNIIYLNDNQDDFVSFCEGSIYDKAIDCIEWLIKEGYFPKEYLV